MLSRSSCALASATHTGFDAHAHARPRRGALLDEEHRRDVGAVERDPRRDVRQLRRPGLGMRVTQNVVTRAGVREHHALVGRRRRRSGTRRAAARTPSGTRAALAEDLPFSSERRNRDGARPACRCSRAGSASRRSVTGLGSCVAASARLDGSKHSMSVIAPTRSSAQRALTRMPVASRRAAGVDRVQHRGVGAVELDQRPRERPVERLPAARRVDPRPGRDDARVGRPRRARSRSSPVTGSYSAGGTSTRPSAARTPTIRRSRSAVRNAPMIGPVERV